MQHTPCSPVDRKALLVEVTRCVTECLDSCAKAGMDLAGVEMAVGKAVEQFTRLVRQAGATEAMAEPVRWRCPQCGQFLAYHDAQTKGVVLRQGLVDLVRGRYRCSACAKEYLPVDVLNDLARTGFSLGARETGVQYAVQLAFAPASDWVKPLFPVSAKSLERMVARAAGRYRQDLAEAVGAYYGDRARPGLVPTGKPKPLINDWQVKRLPEGAVLCIAADAGMVRSTTLGEDGRLQWFAARAGTISVTYQGKELPLRVAGGKLYLAGVMDLDELFGLLGVGYETLPEELKALRCVFTGDGDKWWERQKEYFPQARDILDLYHAAENLAGAAALCFGEGAAKTEHWRGQAREWLKVPGRLEELLGELARARPSIKEEPEKHHKLKNAIGYFRQHRHRMRYWEYEAEGLPLGSGVIESGIKQTVIARARQAGMKWTRRHADDILRLRGAYLSRQLSTVFQRRREVCLEAARAFNEDLQLAA